MITKETVIGEIVQKGDKYIEILINAGMHCLGCPSSRGESIEQACAVHGVDCEVLVERLKNHIGQL